MAGIAGSSRRKVIGRLTASRTAIVAGEASTRRDTRMAECCRPPANSPMTAIATCAGWNVRCRLAGRPRAIMASHTATGSHTGMVVTRCYKHPVGYAHTMTRIARGRRGHVRCGLASSLNSIVTRDTCTGRHPQVLKGSACPRNRPMTVITRERCWNVRSRLTLRRTVVMARQTTSRGNAVMGKEGRLPIRRPVAAITI